MAEMYTPEEIAEIFEAYNEAVANGTPISRELAQQMKDAAKGVKNYTRELNASMNQLGTSIKNLGGSIYKGEKGAAVFSDSIESAGDVVVKYTAKMGLFGQAIGLATKALTLYIGAVNKQSDALFETFQKVSRAGVAGAGGMTEVFNSMVKFGYTVDQLNEMTTLLRENSKNFGLFNATAIQGAKQFENVADALQNSGLRQQFFNMGLSVDDINKGLAGYINQEGKLGRLRGKTTEDLIKGSQSYIREMEILTRLTGQTREEQEQARERAMTIDAFYANLKGMDPKVAEQILQTFTRLDQIDPKMATEFAANIGGVITGTTDLLIATGGASAQLTKDFFLAGKTSNDAIDLLGKSVKPMEGVIDAVARVGGQFGLTSRSATMLINKGLDPQQDAYDRARKAVEDAAAGTDSATNAQARMRDSQIKASQSMAEFVNLGVNPVTKAMATLAAVVENLTSMLPGAGRVRQRMKDEEAARQGKTTANQDMVAASQGSTADMITGGAVATLSKEEMGIQDLRIKSPEAYAGGATSQSLITVARAIQEKLGDDLVHFSAFNDSYHRGENSLHRQGRALDFTIRDPARSAQIASIVQGLPGVSKVIDEYVNPSPHATGKHIHAEIQALRGAVLSGPTSGYKPNLTMHGTEAVVPLPDGRSIPVTQTGSSEQLSLMSEQLNRMDEMVNVLKNQLSVSNKLLQYQQ